MPTPVRAKPSSAPGTASKSSRKPQRRLRGRPLGEQSVGQQAILDSTVALLKTRTPEELTILEVAAAANVTRTLVRYYFGDLHGLLRAVTEHLIETLQDETQRLLRPDGSLYERVHQRLTLLLGFMREHPQFQRLALTEIYYAKSDAGETGLEGPASTPLQRVARRGLQLTRMLLDEPSAASVDPRFIHLSILGTAAFIAPAQPLLTTLFGVGAKGDKLADDYIAFVARMLTDRIEACAVVPDR